MTVKSVMNCCISSTMDGTDGASCGMSVKTMGMLRVSSLKMKALAVKMETVTLIGKGR